MVQAQKSITAHTAAKANMNSACLYLSLHVLQLWPHSQKHTCAKFNPALFEQRWHRNSTSRVYKTNANLSSVFQSDNFFWLSYSCEHNRMSCNRKSLATYMHIHSQADTQTSSCSSAFLSAISCRSVSAWLSCCWERCSSRCISSSLILLSSRSSPCSPRSSCSLFRSWRRRKKWFCDVDSWLFNCVFPKTVELNWNWRMALDCIFSRSFIYFIHQITSVQPLGL